MNPREYYHLKTASITEADVRLVAACMTDYIGEENAVRIESLAGRVGFGERREAMLAAKIPSALELNRTEARSMQTGLF